MDILVGRYELISHGVFDSQNVFKETSSYLKGELIYSNENFLSVLILFKESPEKASDLLAYSGVYKL